jgi:hypothetical protein
VEYPFLAAAQALRMRDQAGMHPLAPCGISEQGGRGEGSDRAAGEIEGARRRNLWWVDVQFKNPAIAHQLPLVLFETILGRPNRQGQASNLVSLKRTGA